MTRRIAKFKITMELIRDALQMPEETIIQNISLSNEGHVFDFVVTHPDLPEVEEGEQIPEIVPVIERVRWDWNV